MTFYLIVAFSIFAIAILGTRLVLLELKNRPFLIDIPNARSNHKMPIPRGGGIAVVTAMVIGLLLMDADYSIILALLILASVSLVDDLLHLSPILRLAVQFLAVTIPLCGMEELVFGGLFPMWLDKLVVGILWVGFTNIFNFMDGIDGISASETISVCTGIFVLCAITGQFPDPLSSYSLVVAMAACGFLWWNWHPAKIFLGDVGSIPLGFILGYLLMLAVLHGYGYAAAILPAYYIADGGITLFKRLAKGQKVWVAHSKHYYQRAARKGMRHDAVVRYIIGINLLLAMLAVLSVLHKELAGLYLAVAYMAVFMLLGVFAHDTQSLLDD